MRNTILIAAVKMQTQNDLTDFSSEMVVHLGSDRPIDTNAVVFGEVVAQLIEASVNHMLELFHLDNIPRNQGTRFTDRIRHWTREMNK